MSIIKIIDHMWFVIILLIESCYIVYRIYTTKGGIVVTKSIKQLIVQIAFALVWWPWNKVKLQRHRLQTTDVRMTTLIGVVTKIYIEPGSPSFYPIDSYLKINAHKTIVRLNKKLIKSTKNYFLLENELS